MAATYAVREALWLRKFREVFQIDDKPITVYGDNQGALKLAKNPIEGARSKHIDVQWHFVRQRENRQQICMRYTKSSDNAADLGSKAVSRATGFILAGLLGLGTV